MVQELREQYNSMSEILTEIEDSNVQEKSSMNAINGGQANFERKAEFLNKEISFLLDNLRRVIFTFKIIIIESNRQWAH